MGARMSRNSMRHALRTSVSVFATIMITFIFVLLVTRGGIITGHYPW